MSEFDVTNELHTQIQYRLIEKLSESERRYRELVENLREIVFKCDPLGHLTFVNKAWTTILGHPVKDVLNKPLSDFIAPCDRQKWQQILEMLNQQTSICQELRFFDERGAIIWLELSVLASDQSEFSGSLVDITVRKQAEVILQRTNEELERRVKQRTEALTQANQELTAALQELQQTQGQLLQAEKMSSLGQLVAGIAHEINNPITFVHGNLAHLKEYVQELMCCLGLYQIHYPNPAPTIQTALEETDLDFLQEDLPKLISSMKVGTERIEQIILSLRNFSRMDESELKTVNIHEGIDSTLMILNHRFQSQSSSRAINILQEYENLPLVNCYPGQFNQVVMNILTNAIDAIQQRQTQHNRRENQEYLGQITIRTLTLNPQWIQITITDNGIGIPEDVQKNIFDPFFTTKPVGRGTGMGMAISYQIITENHGGILKCISTFGKGTEFIIQIPIQKP